MIATVGELQFQPEANFETFLKGKDDMYNTNILTIGEYIWVEVV